MDKSWLLKEFKLEKYIKSFFKQLDKVLYVLKIIKFNVNKKDLGVM